MKPFIKRWIVEFILLAGLLAVVLSVPDNNMSVYIFKAVAIVMIVFLAIYVYSNEEHKLTEHLEPNISEDEVDDYMDEMALTNAMRRAKQDAFNTSKYCILTPDELKHLHKFPNDTFDDIYILSNKLATRNINHGLLYVVPVSVYKVIHEVFMRHNTSIERAKRS